MLEITIPATKYDELWNEENGEFIPIQPQKEQTLQLEHSLISLSKWESKWCKPFFSKKEKTYEETIDYIRCMTLTKNVDPKVYDRLTEDNVREIYKYINAPMTATTFYEDHNDKKGRKETITSELMYYWMIEFHIPFECEKWHVNRLTTLVQICKIKNTPPKKRSRREIMSRNAALNEARKRQLNTKG